MSKTQKKLVKKAAAAKPTAKPAAKKQNKETVKKTANKPTVHKQASKPLVKTLVKAVGKLLGKTEKVKTKEEKPEKKTAKTTSAPKDAKKNKKPKKPSPEEEFDLGDDLIGDDDMGSEDIPDLAEFEEIETEVEETEAETEAIPSHEGARAPDAEIVLTDAEGRRYCRVRDCDQISSVEGYCRFHYLLLWKRIQIRRKILADGKLERYVEELTSRYPDKFLEMIRRDLRTEKDFLGAIAELEIDESAGDNDFEDEAQSFADEIRGMSETSASVSDDDEF